MDPIRAGRFDLRDFIGKASVKIGRQNRWRYDEILRETLVEYRVSLGLVSNHEARTSGRSSGEPPCKFWRIKKADFDHLFRSSTTGGAVLSERWRTHFFPRAWLTRALIASEAKPKQLDGRFSGPPSHEPKKTGYVHLVGIHPDFRRRGVGRLLYARFTEECSRAGLSAWKAITTLGNERLDRISSCGGAGTRRRHRSDYAGAGRL